MSNGVMFKMTTDVDVIVYPQNVLYLVRGELKATLTGSAETTLIMFDKQFGVAVYGTIEHVNDGLNRVR